MTANYDELIDQIAAARRPRGGIVWEPDELRDVLRRAARLPLADLARVVERVGIRFEGNELEDAEQYLMVLDEANDKEALKRVLDEYGV